MVGQDVSILADDNAGSQALLGESLAGVLGVEESVVEVVTEKIAERRVEKGRGQPLQAVHLDPFD